jgi:hypothetical protein
MSPAAPDSDLHLLLFGQGINVTAAEKNHCRLAALFVVSGEPAAIDKPSLLSRPPRSAVEYHLPRLQIEYLLGTFTKQATHIQRKDFCQP